MSSMATLRGGVYALVHRATGQLYIGSSRNFRKRRRQWWDRMNREHQNLPPPIRALTSSRHDWEFKVLWDGTGQPSEQLHHREAEAVAQVRLKAPDKLLNSIPVQRADLAGLRVGERIQSLNAWSRETGVPRATISARLQYGWAPEQAVGAAAPPVRDRSAEHRAYSFVQARTLILDDNGEPMTQPEAAKVLGCSATTLAERLRNRRNKLGETKVRLSDLKALSEKHSPKKI